MSRPDAVIVTGASRGLGRAVVQRCMAEGVPVLGIARTAGAAESLTLDLSDLAGTERAVRAWIDGQPYRRLAVVCAAGTLGQQGGILDGDLADWGRTLQTNVLGNFAVIRALLPRMIENQYGRIVTVAGGGAAYAYPLFSGYALSKTAVVRATENLDAELRGKGDFLTVCLAPGAMETEMLAKVRAAGAEVKTTVAIEEPVEFIANFIRAETCGFSGRFVHVRDTWRDWLMPEPVPGDRWMLRRIEK
ncbi:MAG: SDR family oxidoreductase [Chthoniobacter sp.]|uniref:SDR family oxidoreductase n=1 Tax=Chthoniobacter sp. TaxID=2510640 RepID=UPI0032A91BFB